MEPLVPLSDEDKRVLLKTARMALEVTVGLRQQNDLDALRTIDIAGGAFVTIWRSGTSSKELRGCIGRVLSDEPLSKTIVRMTAEAARKDPRFPPVGKEELPELLVEISVLSVPRRGRPEDVQPGVHGVLLRSGTRSGLLLPQVATERDWDRETFLDHCCLKAGLKTGCWKGESVELSLFTATVFDESSLRV